MHVSIDPADARPIYQQIMDEVRRALSIGTLGPEDPLPSVRQMASDLRVNPNTVQQAYRELERSGLVYVRRGQGTFVSQSAQREEEKKVLAGEVAERALRDAWRHGIAIEALKAALTEAASRIGGNGRPAEGPDEDEKEEDAE